MHPEYRNVSQFSAPAGVDAVQVDPQSGELATASCPRVITEYFVEGTQPVETCHLHGGGGGARVAGARGGRGGHDAGLGRVPIEVFEPGAFLGAEGVLNIIPQVRLGNRLPRWIARVVRLRDFARRSSVADHFKNLQLPIAQG